MQFDAPIAATALDLALEPRRSNARTGSSTSSRRRPGPPADRGLAGLGRRPGAGLPDGDASALAYDGPEEAILNGGPTLYARRLAAWGRRQGIFQSAAEARGFRDALPGEPAVRTGRAGRPRRGPGGARPDGVDLSAFELEAAVAAHAGRRAPGRGDIGGARRGRDAPAGGDGRHRPLRGRARRLRRRPPQSLPGPRRAPGPRGRRR